MRQVGGGKGQEEGGERGKEKRGRGEGGADVAEEGNSRRYGERGEDRERTKVMAGLRGRLWREKPGGGRKGGGEVDRDER